MMSHHPLGRTFHDCVQEYANRVERTKQSQRPPANAAELGAMVSQLIATTTDLTTVHDQDTLDAVRTAYQILDETAFNAQYVLTHRDRNARSQRIAPAALVDRTNGFHHEGVVYLRAPRPVLQDCVHEAMHLLSWRRATSAWRVRFGLALEEGAAEYMSRLVHKRHKLTYTEGSYHRNVAVIDFLVERAGLDDAALVRAYFGGGVGPVADALQRAIPEQLLTRMIEAQDRQLDQTYPSWIAEARNVPGGSGLAGRLQSLGARIRRFF
jgi:hypothetical protein